MENTNYINDEIYNKEDDIKDRKLKKKIKIMQMKKK